MVGGSGVLGRAMVPHLASHQVVATTRSSERISVIEELGARGVLCDIYAPGALDRVAVDAGPEIVVNLLTDLAGGVGPANSRIRREGGPVVIAAAGAAGARRLVVESVAWGIPGPGGEAVAALEAGTLTSGLDPVVIRFGRLWGPGTWNAAPPEPPAVHVVEAGRRAAELALTAPSGTYVVA